MLTVIHLSDLHVHKRKGDPDNKNAAWLVKHLIDRFGGQAKADTYVVLSGDLVDDGDLRQYRHLEAEVLRPLARRFTLLPAPGNHDYAWLGNLLKPKSVGLFDQFVVQANQKPVGPGRFPRVTEHARERALFVGLDSADPDGRVGCAEGIVDATQRKELAKVLRAPQYKTFYRVVYLHHHPFDRGLAVKLNEVDKLLEVLGRNAHLVLFGHKHQHGAFYGWHHVPLMLASGKVTEAASGNALTYRVLEISKGERQRVYTEEVGRAPGTA